MTKDRQQATAVAEPMGIVISGGYRTEPAPAFWAYVWSDVPESDFEQKSKVAA
jgi:hypothetical protein